MPTKDSKRHAGTIYYALAIMDFLERYGEGSTSLIGDIIEEFKSNPAPLVEIKLLTEGALMDEALVILTKSGGIEIDKDDYAPPIVTLKAALDQLGPGPFNATELATIERYEKAGTKQRAWLISALEKLRQELDPIEEDEEEDEEIIDGVLDSTEADWEPLPLDRQDQNLTEVIQKIDELTENVRGDNGYGANFGEEKKFVLDKLFATSKTLKEQASISWIYIREFAIKPIVILSKRFGAAAIGVAAEAAKAAIKEWLKKKGLTFFDSL